MSNSKTLKQNLLCIDENINEVVFNHSVAEQLVQVLFKNYIGEDTPKDKENCILFAAQHEEIRALLFAINEFIQMNTHLMNDVCSGFADIYTEVNSYE